MSSSWQLAHAQRIASDPKPETRLFFDSELARSIPNLYLWDPWPVQTAAGEIARVDDAQLWMALSASSAIAPGARHDVARIRLLTLKEVGGRPQWQDQGHVFPDASTPGSREWAGCATYFASSSELELCYTASGIRGETSASFIQRIFTSTARLQHKNSQIELSNWTDHQELIQPETLYQSTMNQLTGAAGHIKGFRDPFRFVDPENGQLYVLFTASMMGSKTDFDGVVGVARGSDLTDLALLPPLLTADGVNNELERPHVVFHDGLYYLFFSTQTLTFHADVSAPTGLYGFVANRMDGQWRPLNGSGLVFSNPVAEPFQAYSWYVMQNLTVASFVDFPRLEGVSLAEVEANESSREHFVGSIAPLCKISLQGDRALLTKEG